MSDTRRDYGPTGCVRPRGAALLLVCLVAAPWFPLALLGLPLLVAGSWARWWARR